MSCSYTLPSRRMVAVAVVAFFLCSAVGRAGSAVAFARDTQGSAKKEAGTVAATKDAEMDAQALDFLKLVVKDVHEDPATTVLVGRDIVEPRRPPNFGWMDYEYDPETDGDAEIRDIHAFRFRAEGRELVALTFALDVAESGERGVVALIDRGPEPRLLDVLDVTGDQHTSLLDDLVDIGSGNQAFEIDNWHDNSSESYDNLVYVAVVGGRLSVVLDGPGFRGFADYDEKRERLCKTVFEHAQHILRSRHFGYRDIAIDVKELKVCHSNDEPDWDWKTGIVRRVSTRQIWRWDPRHKTYRRVGRAPRAAA